MGDWVRNKIEGSKCRIAGLDPHLFPTEQNEYGPQQIKQRRRRDQAPSEVRGAKRFEAKATA